MDSWPFPENKGDDDLLADAVQTFEQQVGGALVPVPCRVDFCCDPVVDRLGVHERLYHL